MLVQGQCLMSGRPFYLLVMLVCHVDEYLHNSKAPDSSFLSLHF